MYRPSVENILNQAPEEALHQLATMPESQWFERKSGRIAPRDLAVPLVAMANAEGGHVAVGFEDGEVRLPPEQKLNDLRQAAHDFTVPVVRTEILEIPREGDAAVLLIRVVPGEQVHETSKGECYLRVGDESRRLSYAQRRELEFDRSPAPFDSTPVPGRVAVADLASTAAQAYQQQIGAADLESMLRARDLLTRTGEPTVASWLLFQERPQQEFPSAHVRVLRYTENHRGTGAGMTLHAGGDIRCEGPIPQQIDQAAGVIEDWVPKVQALAASGRFESRPIIPRDVWLEGLVNAVLHRSYSMAGDHIRVEIFPSRIEIESPGRFPGLADPEHPLSISRYARNPRIVRVCSELGIARELGEGIRRIFEEMRANGLTDPIYTQTTSTVRLTLLASNAIPERVLKELAKGARQVLNIIRQEARPMSTGEIADLAQMARPTVIRHLKTLRNLGLVVWDGQSSRDPRASWKLP